MQQYIQFETIIKSGLIRIPEQYIKKISTAVKVTLTPANGPHIKMGTKSKAGMLSLDDFSTLKIDTEGWKFNREEANERR